VRRSGKGRKEGREREGGRTGSCARPGDRQLGRWPRFRPTRSSPGAGRLRAGEREGKRARRRSEHESVDGPAAATTKGSRAGRTVLEVDVCADAHLARDSLEDEALLPPARVRELDLAVEAARAQQGRVERVGAVRRHDDLDVRPLVEAVHLGEELDQDALHLAVGARLGVEALGRDRVDLHGGEHDRRQRHISQISHAERERGRDAPRR